MPAMRAGALDVSSSLPVEPTSHSKPSKHTPGGKGKGKKQQKDDAEAEPVEVAKAAELDDETLNALIEQDAEDIRQLVHSIPPIHYKAPDADRQLSLSLKYMKKAGNTVSEKVARAQKKSKKSKFNPDAEKADADSDAQQDSEDENDSDDSEEEEEAQQPARKAGQKPDTQRLPGTTRVKSVAELQARLHERIAQSRGGRPVVDEKAGEDEESKKRKREERKEKKKKKKKVQDTKSSVVPTPCPMPKETPRSNPKKDADDEVEGDFSFGRIKMGGEDIIGGAGAKTNKYRGDPKKLLAKVEERKKKIEELGGSETEEGKALSDKLRWGSVIDRAQGVKVKDDATMLKKTIKKREHQKEKSKDKWLKRAEKIEEQRSKKLKARNENIEKRKGDRRDKKMGIKKIKKKPAAGGGKEGGGGGGFLKDFSKGSSPSSAGKERRPGFEGRGPRG